MKIVFFGTPDFVLPVLNVLNKSFRSENSSPFVCVVTQKPKPAGRKKILAFSPVDRWAYKKKIPVVYDPLEIVKMKIKADIGVLAAYGSILPKSLINYFPNGILNIHPSLLPKYRGPSPVQATIIGKDEAGVTIIKLDDKIDHGPVVAQFKIKRKNTDTTGTLTKRCFLKSAGVLKKLITPYTKGKIKINTQDNSKATYTKLITKADGYIPPKYLRSITNMNEKNFPDKSEGIWKINFTDNLKLKPDVLVLDRFIKAMDPWPSAWSSVILFPSAKPKRIKILKSHIKKESSFLFIDDVQLEGKKPVSWQQFKKGYPSALFL